MNITKYESLLKEIELLRDIRNAQVDLYTVIDELIEIEKNLFYI
jgi:hypothetical protein